MKCVECGDEAIAIAGGYSYCQIHLEANMTIRWGEAWENSIERNRKEEITA